MTARTLVASSNGRRVGVLTDDKGVWSFEYCTEWIAATGAFPISPAFPLAVQRIIDNSTERPVQWFFDNLRPKKACARRWRVRPGSMPMMGGDFWLTTAGNPQAR